MGLTHISLVLMITITSYFGIFEFAYRKVYKDERSKIENESIDAQYEAVVWSWKNLK